MRSISGVASVGTPTSVLGYLLERSNLDSIAACTGRLRGPVERRVEIGRRDHPDPSDVLLAFYERAVRGQQLAIFRSYDGGSARRVEATGEYPGSSRLQLGVKGSNTLVRFLHLIGKSRGASLDSMHAQQVLLH